LTLLLVKCVDGTTFRVKFKKNKPKQIKPLRLANQNIRRKPLEAEGIIPIVLGYYMLVRFLYYFLLIYRYSTIFSLLYTIRMCNKAIIALFDVMLFLDSFLSRSNN